MPVSGTALAASDRGAETTFAGRTTLDERLEHDGTVARAVVRAKQGDSEALRFLYVRYVDNVYGYVKSIVRDEHDAEDVTQHVFAKLLVVLPKYEERNVPFFAWILRVARNVALDHLRRRIPIPCEDIHVVAEDSDEPDPDLSLKLRAALDELPSDQRKVVVLRHVVGLSPGEIAERLGKTESSIHGLHHRARCALKDGLRAHDVRPSAAAS